MKIPEFTAEASLGPSSNAYSGRSGSGGLMSRGTIVPAVDPLQIAALGNDLKRQLNRIERCACNRDLGDVKNDYCRIMCPQVGTGGEQICTLVCG